jgi:NRAMP (natural resistance-associated macrophage protein)-like metal ion transporter
MLERPPHTPDESAQASKDPLRSAVRRADPQTDVMVKGSPRQQPPNDEIRNPADALRSLGPGLIGGTSNLDPSAIGTYSQAGGAYGNGLLWSAVYTYPLIAAVQEMCGRIALQTGVGLGRVLRMRLPAWAAGALVLALVVANIVNIAADLGAVSAGVDLLSGGRLARAWVVAPVGIGILAALTLLSYEDVARVLKWLSLVLMAYVVTALLTHPALVAVIRAALVPHVSLNSAFLGQVVAIIGTTVSPYVFFWQASAQMDARRAEGGTSVRRRAGAPRGRVQRTRLDILVGTFFAQVVMFSILLTSGTTLYGHGGDNIQSAQQAAQSLAPLAGPAASVLFALGIIGAGLLAIPVMAGSALYAVREFAGFGGTLGLKARYRPTFYALFALGMAAAIAINYLGINPIRALLLAAGINGMLAPLLLAAIIAVAVDRGIMGERVSGRLSRSLCGATAVIAGAAALAFIITSLLAV